LSDEIDTWINKVDMNPDDPLKSSWIGGCLPLWGVCGLSFSCLYIFWLFFFLFWFTCFACYLSYVLFYNVMLLQIVYMDFIDFNGLPVNIDYRTPRISHVKNQDFIQLERFDRKVNIVDGYGALPVSNLVCFLLGFLVGSSFSYPVSDFSTIFCCWL
jgi:hypothetical protein